MGVGPNYGLSKGFLVGGATAIAYGEIAVADTAEQSAKRAIVASAVVPPLGVFQEDVDTTRLATGKVFANVQIHGLVRVLVGAAVAKGDRVTNDTTARAVTVTRAAAGAQPAAVLGIAQNAATAAGQFIDVLLTPGASF
jgi:hypothetical protein